MNRVFIVGLCMLLPAFLTAGESDYQRWKRESLQDYQRYRSEQDQAFGNYLAKQWQEFRLFKGEKRDPTPKPKLPPQVGKPDTGKMPAEPARPAVTLPETPAPAVPLPNIVPERHVIPPVVTPSVRDSFQFDFFGHQLTLPDYSLPSFSSQGKSANLAISEWWQSAANGDYQRLVDELERISKELQLSDWGRYLLVREYARAAIPKVRNDQVLAQWFFLTRLGYASKIAYASGDLVLLLQSRQPLYEMLYLNYGANRFYVVDAPRGMGTILASYDGTHPQVQKLFSMEQSLRLFDNQAPTMHRPLTFVYNGRQYQVGVKYPKQAIDYLGTVPPTELSVYFNAPQGNVLRAQLVEQLRPLVAGMSKEQAVNLLLAFVQKSFNYATDEQQFGREHYMFADELFYYPSSDCEDRAVLFAHLVRELLELEVVGLSYEGHVATAVAVDGVKGRIVSHRNREYLVADPTYINASIGMEMPQYRGSTPQIIEIR